MAKQRTVKLFGKRLPVRGNAPIIHFKDGDYRFWSIMTKNGESCLTFREMVARVTIQERVDWWLLHELDESHIASLTINYADHIAPATIASVRGWAEAHPRQMRKYDFWLNR